ncbi:MAG TPA: S8 family serine peptidase [Casimicrobiaceae bacterium]|nr:S8 family serine peptidase [Casimicrobiaceae bacterium]
MLTLKRRTAVALSVAAAIAVVASGSAVAATSDATSTKAVPTQDTNRALVILNGDPLSTYVKTKPAKGKRIDFTSNTTKSYRAQLSALRNDYKKWLQANYPKAKITGNFDISLNAVAVELNGAPLAGIAATPLVKQAQYEGIYHKLNTVPDLALVRAPQAWTSGGGAEHAGEGVKVAIIDTGIDVRHPCFADDKYPAQKQLGDTKFTNNKVIVAKVFNNKAGSRSYTAEAIQDHGTHVAGTVACNFATPATVDGAAIPDPISGVAPKALLGNYNIFPDQVDDARSEDILNALDAAYADGFDVANMSLGGNAHGIQDLLTIAVDNLDQANMVVAVASGNSGPDLRTVESPGSALRALTAGASSVGQQMYFIVSVGGSTTYRTIKGDFGSAPAGGLTAPLAVLLDPASEFGGLSAACDALPAGSLAGKIALLSRGVCDFTVKLQNVQDAGGLAALVVDRADGGPIVMGQNDDPVQPTIPGYMAALSARDALKASDGQSTTFPDIPTYVYEPSGDDLIADFTSAGPTDVDFRAKPDLVAPGVNVLSSVPANACATPPCFAFMNGTSMATPHLAGAAAVVRAQHPEWSAAEIRSAIVNTAVRNVVHDLDGIAIEDVNVVGAGRLDVKNAVDATIALDPVSVNFDAVPSGSGQSRTVNITVRNIGAAAKTLAFGVADSDAGVAYSVSPASASLGAGQSTVIAVTMTAGKGAPVGGQQAFLVINSGGSEVAHAALFTQVK